MAEEGQKPVKVVVVGDGTVGKTCLLLVYANKGFPERYVPTVMDSYSAQLNVDGQSVPVGVWDTAGQEDFNHIRPLSYPGTDVFVICFSLVDRMSFRRVSTMWYPEIHEHEPRARVLLVGTKLDLRENEHYVNQMKEREGLQPVLRNEGEIMKDRVGAVNYVECSAKENNAVDDVFRLAIRAGLQAPPVEAKKKACCDIM